MPPVFFCFSLLRKKIYIFVDSCDTKGISVWFFSCEKNKKIVIEIFKLSLTRSTVINMNPHHLQIISSILRTILISSFTLHSRTSALKDRWIWNLKNSIYFFVLWIENCLTNRFQLSSQNTDCLWHFINVCNELYINCNHVT